MSSKDEKVFVFHKGKHIRKYNKYKDRSFYVVRGMCGCNKQFYNIFSKKSRALKSFYICPYCDSKIERSKCWYGGIVRGQNVKDAVRKIEALGMFKKDIPNNLKVML